MKDAEIDVNIKRPSNIATFEDIVSISASTPSRSAEVFKLTLKKGVLSVSQKMSFTDTLVTYGYGPIFTGIINNQNKISIYNPLNGVYYYSDISKWDRDEDLLDYLINKVKPNV